MSDRISTKEFKEKYGSDLGVLKQRLALQSKPNKKPSDAQETLVITKSDKASFVVPFPPSLNQAYPTNRQGRRFLSTRGQEFKKAATEAITKQRVGYFTGNLIVTLKLYRPRKIGDIDNFSKLIFDVCKGLVFDDDKQIVELRIKRYDDKNNPRVEVEITQINSQNG
jgi:Holliday junction resolvase RusA-like endonuclease